VDFAPPSAFSLAVARSLGGALLVGLAGVVWSQRRSLGELRRCLYFQRWACWLAITISVAGATLLGPLPLAGLLAAAAWQAAREHAGLRHGGGEPGWVGMVVPVLVAAAPLEVTLGLSLGLAAAVGLVATIGLLGAGSLLRLSSRRAGLPDVTADAFAYLWIGLGLAHLADLRTEHGPEPVVLTCAMVGLGDVGAFVVGRTLGGPRLAPRISPNKRWSGVAGNVLGGLLALALLPAAIPPGWGMERAIELALVVAGASVLGDLLESQQKRRAGVKDAGRLLPGFGGLLDRIDSLLLAAPAAYWFITVP
jgi:phosphatidate cytidylyltransferase